MNLQCILSWSTANHICLKYFYTLPCICNGPEVHAPPFSMSLKIKTCSNVISKRPSQYNCRCKTGEKTDIGFFFNLCICLSVSFIWPPTLPSVPPWALHFLILTRSHFCLVASDPALSLPTSSQLIVPLLNVPKVSGCVTSPLTSRALSVSYKLKLAAISV